MTYYYFAGRFDTKDLYTYKEFTESLEKGDVESVTIRPNAQGTTGQIIIRMKENEIHRMYVTDVREVEKEAAKYDDVEIAVDDIPADNSMMNSVFMIIAAAGIFMLFFVLMNRQGGGTNAQMMNFGKSRARMTTADEQSVTFDDVAGLEEEKQDLEELVDFLRDPAKYTALGARIPKGVLLVGPPGTGKTLIAKAVAGEAGVPFFSISGSDFVEMFVGVGASRVRDLFTDAKNNHPCIVFIDEIDAVARRRGAGLGGGHDEREQTLNQLLVEMDGFGVNEGIIVLAATNRVDILDPAILRPGRFDRKVAVGMPDVKGRREILAVHAKNKPLSDDVDLDQIAQTTAGISVRLLSRSVSELKSAARSCPEKIRKLQHITNPGMPFCSMCSRRWDQSTLSLLSRQDREQQATQCRCRRKMRSSTPEAACLKRSQWISEGELPRRSGSAILRQAHPRISSRLRRWPKRWS